ncbi:aminoglycoside phosphotransferase family protein [Aspergillus ruber CBS 135680]|uniref:Kinase-like protein n=1 Tax=Aspergillus ruber (strain CBS 135680) TaxID=1388766 RepID=A0A017SCD5_ASPRC|nr:kinase-like protein [Aspergillus ruber CBS 135680]EYE94304.1 kinase-like protein [Aspergillus ruber CBS 135680]
MAPIPTSASFKNHRAPTLPSPAEIRALNIATNKPSATSFNCPPPVLIPPLGLAVKYGADVTILEAETQVMIREKLQGRIPVPEVFGWEEDGEQGFLYMELVEGDTLMKRWSGLSEDEIRSICGELRGTMELVRRLEQSDGPYIGSLNNQPLKDLFLIHHPSLKGPYFGPNAIDQFQETCGLWTTNTNQTPIVFTHNDLLPPNILISAGPNPKVTAIINWAQAGWYPAYWEYCKARYIRVNPGYFSDAAIAEWRTKYLPLIVDAVDEEEGYHPWLYFALSKRP